MICESYRKLSHPEKIIFLGEVIHCVQNSENAFKAAAEIVNKELKAGTLEGVKILPEPNPNDKLNY